MLFEDLTATEIDSLRILADDIIEINEDITLILICPPAEHICVMNTKPNSADLSSPTADKQATKLTVYKLASQTNLFTYLPLQIFEAIHLSSYNSEFINTYVKLSIRLEIEGLASNQYHREAFSNEEIKKSKSFVNTVNKYQKQLDEIWRESRWIIQAINNARAKLQPKESPPSNHILKFSELNNVLHELVKKEKHRLSKANIYNQITKLPNDSDKSSMASCSCRSQVENSSDSASGFSEAFSSSIEDLRSNSVLVNRSAVSDTTKYNNNSLNNKNIYNLVTRLYDMSDLGHIKMVGDNYKSNVTPNCNRKQSELAKKPW